MTSYTTQELERAYPSDAAKELMLRHRLEHFKAAHLTLMNSVLAGANDQKYAAFSLNYLKNFSILYHLIGQDSELVKVFKYLKTHNTIDLTTVSSDLTNAMNEAILGLLDYDLTNEQEAVLFHIITGDQPHSIIDLNNFSKVLLTNSLVKPFVPSIGGLDAKEFILIQNNELKQTFTLKCHSEFAVYYPDSEFVCSQHYIDFVHKFFEDIGLYKNIHDEL